MEFCGWNGTGGVSIIKRSKWNGGDFMFCEPANLSWEDSQKLIGEILLPAPASQPLSAPAEKKEWITADDFLEHAYVTNDSSDGISTVECKCGITFLSQNEDSGRARKRHSDHRLIALNARLAPRIEAHIAAAYRDVSQHDCIWQRGNCRCGKKLNDYETGDITWDEHICALTPADAARALELAEVRAALKEAEWWQGQTARMAEVSENATYCRGIRDRRTFLLAREAELLERGRGK